jgi:putative DNA primase/helicase
MTAEIIAKALGGRKAGTAWIAPCPAHKDREPSLSIKDAEGGKLLVHCHAGCDQRQVIAELRSHGLWHEGTTIERAGIRNWQRPPHTLAGNQLKVTLF